MIVPHPTDEQILSAQVITFYDPQRPEFNRVIVDALDRSMRTPKDVVVIDIGMDSTNPDVLEFWTDRITSVRANHAG
jgi:hypothetical protein